MLRVDDDKLAVGPSAEGARTPKFSFVGSKPSFSASPMLCRLALVDGGGWASKAVGLVLSVSASAGRGGMCVSLGLGAAAAPAEGPRARDNFLGRFCTGVEVVFVGGPVVEVEEELDAPGSPSVDALRLCEEEEAESKLSGGISVPPAPADEEAVVLAVACELPMPPSPE